MKEIESQIIDDLMSEIASKKLSAGAKLPSENKLAQQYNVPRMTIRNALIKLEQQGIIFSRQGKGRYLKEESQPIQLDLTGKTSFTEKMQQLGYRLETQNLSCRAIEADSSIRQLLRAKQEETIFEIRRIRFVNSEALAIHTSYIRKKQFPHLKEDGSSIESTFAYYRRHGHKQFTSSKSLLSIAFPTAEEQQLLSCESMVPLIVVESDCMDTESGEILECTKVAYRGDKFKYDITMD